MTHKIGDDWQCPYCGRQQAITEPRYNRQSHRISNDTNVLGKLAYEIESIVCANHTCKQITLAITLSHREDTIDARGASVFIHRGVLRHWRLLPESIAKPLPNFVPEVLRNDYLEACQICDLSPKASATLSRRCLQGMIRDFCAISKARLIDEIEELERRVQAGTAPVGVQPDTIDAIDHVRKIGNIGAHMEKDINLIIDVDPGEAEQLIGLLELLFDEWYVARHTRAERLSKLKATAAKKENAKKSKESP